MLRPVTLLLTLFFATVSYAQIAKKDPPIRMNWPRYNTEALLRSLRNNKLLDSLLTDGSKFYYECKLDEASFSRQAFLFGYLGKKLDDLKKIQINANRKVHWPFNHLVMIVDFTQIADQKRMVIIDVATRKLLFHTYVGHGKGKYYDDPVNENPRFFSNVIGSNMSSLGFMVTGGPKMPPGNPCHFCRFNATGPAHTEQLYVHGFEPSFNDAALDRKILVHTTGSKDLSDAATKKRLDIENNDYRVDESHGRCYFEKDKFSTIYASKVYIDSTGYIGRSDGCFVVPEQEHIAIVKAINRGTLIFSYSDVIIDLKTYSYNYFDKSPVIQSIRKLAGLTNDPTTSGH
jgi:hypothetical protein